MDYIKWVFIFITIFGFFVVLFWMHADEPIGWRSFFTFSWVANRGIASTFCFLFFGSIVLVYTELSPQTKVAFWDFLCDLICTAPVK